MRCVIAILLLATQACGTSKQTAYYNAEMGGLALTITDLTIGEIEAASGEAFMHVDPDDADFEITIRFETPANPKWVGSVTWTDETCLIRVHPWYDLTNTPGDRDQLAPYYVGILRHEIGHCFGLGHSADREDVMYPTNTLPGPGAFERFVAALTAIRYGY